LDLLDHEAMRSQGREKIYHPGTYNGNPVSAAAGVATLSIVGGGGVCEAANRAGQQLREGFAAVAAAEGVRWGVYGSYSALHICLNPELDIDPLAFRPEEHSRQELQAKPPEQVRRLRMAMLIHGVDLSGWPGGLASAVHTQEDITATIDAFRASLRLLKREGLV
ncbi:MAG: aspartate aminotransferase family protein, partial [Rhizobiales bacterium]|nr:aspartate aminotransferase family protein [Hyphomicrobiales bacterium]